MLRSWGRNLLAEAWIVLTLCNDRVALVLNSFVNRSLTRPEISALYSCISVTADLRQQVEFRTGSKTCGAVRSTIGVTLA